MSEVEKNSINEYVLEVENELRFNVGSKPYPIRLELMTGLAEIFGAEMQLHKTYTFPPHSNISVITWHGCTLKMHGVPESITTSKDEEFIISVVLHAMLEERRIKADSENARGPVTLIVGPKDAGKSSLCQILLNYAARLGRKPLYLELDVGQNSLSIPGTVGFTTVERPTEIVEGFDDRLVRAYYFGNINPMTNIALYFLMLDNLGKALKNGLRQAGNNIKSSGAIINTCGWIEGFGYKALTKAALAFEIDILCVLGSQRLYLSLRKHMPTCVNVHFIPRPKAAVIRNGHTRSTLRKQRVRDYFFGINNQFKPHTIQVPFSNFKWFRSLSSRNYSSEEELTHISLEEMTLVPVRIEKGLMYQMVGISSCDTVSIEILTAHVLGFVCVTGVDVSGGIVQLTLPNAGPIPKDIFLVGDIYFNDFSNK